MSLQDVAEAGRIRAYWPLNEAAGPALESYNGLNGADATGVGSNTGLIYPLAREFVAASSDHFVVPDNGLLDMPSSGIMTFCGWAYQNSIASAQSLFAKWALPNGIVYLVQFESSGKAYRMLLGNATGDNTGAINTDADVIVAAGTWYFIRVEVDENIPRTRIQVNEALGYSTITNPGWSLVDDGSDLWIGSDEATGNDFDGRLQAWALIEGTLLSSEISELYNSGAGFDLNVYSPLFQGGDTARQWYYERRRRA
jgi:hypothetical protein